jgi:hypothetical protein
LLLRVLKEFLLEAGVVRDLRDGRWSALVSAGAELRHRRGKELVKALRNAGRLRSSPVVNNVESGAELDWVKDALASDHNWEKLDGIVATRRFSEVGADADSLITPLASIWNAKWWKDESSSVSVKRCIQDYLKTLAPILKRSNKRVMFIDPHVEPSVSRYQDFLQLVWATHSGSQIEIHRNWNEGSKDNRRNPPVEGWKSRFSEWNKQFARRGLHAKVFFWPKFHDRFLITNLIGLSLPNGFDVDEESEERPTTWCRLSRKDGVAIEKSFDESKGPVCQLTLG